MDFGKLSSNDKTIAVAGVVVVLAGIISNWGGLVWLSVIAAAVAVVVVLLPQLSPSTSLPGSRGSILLALGAVAAVGMIIELLRFIEYFFNTLDDFQTWLFAIALVAAVVMAWVAWREFQAEGGRFRVGTSGSTTTSAAAAAPAAAAPAAAPPAAPPAPPAPAPEPMGESAAEGTEDDDRGGAPTA